MLHKQAKNYLFIKKGEKNPGSNVLSPVTLSWEKFAVQMGQ